MQRLVCLLVLCLLPVFASAATAKYQTMHLEREGDTVKVVMDLSASVKYKYFSLKSPKRFVVDLLDTFRVGRDPGMDLTSTPIDAVRVGIREGGDLRMVLDLNDSVIGDVAVEPPSAGKGYRLVIALKGNGSVAAPQTSAAPVVDRQPVKTDVAVDQPTRDILIAIDAGHGGVDPGAHGSNGTDEKDVVLAIARRLAKQVEKETGMRPLMIRDGDYFVSLRNRVRKARAYQADLFVSIHADAFDDPHVSGSSVYALSQNGATTEAARLLANRENAADLIGGVSIGDKDELLASVLLDLSQNATIEASLDVAGRVLKGLKSKGVSRLHKHRVEQAGFAVLKSPDIPSILVETAFISNPKEERKLRSPKQQQAIAEAIMEGIRSYFRANPPPGTHLAAREHIIKRGDTLIDIAQRYNVSLSDLRQVNHISGDQLRVGEVLYIPQDDS